MLRFFSLTLLSIFLLISFGHSAEIDTITPHDVVLPDAAETINEIINARLQEGINRANDRQDDFSLFSKRKSCDEDILYTELRKAVFQSLSASLGLKGYSLDKQLRQLLKDKTYSLSLEDSIYRDISYVEGISLNLKELSDVVRIGDQLVGLDKVGHFFSEGWGYFQRVDEEDIRMNEALAWGKELEEGSFGYLTTGVFSYADLVANFHGYRFWNGLRKNQQDPMKNIFADFFTPARISCNFELFASIKQRQIVRKWVLQKSFDITNYVDGAWNEANNCNSYKDEAITAKVAGRIADAWPGYSCPADKGVCVQAEKRYGRYANQLLHPKCFSNSKRH